MRREAEHADTSDSNRALREERKPRLDQQATSEQAASRATSADRASSRTRVVYAKISVLKQASCSSIHCFRFWRRAQNMQ